jgi:hypothetical protein
VVRRLLVLLSVVAVVLLSSAVISTRPTAVAQVATPSGMAATTTHPVAGTWTLVNGEGADAFPSIAHFHPDGTYVEVLPWGAVLMGVWQPTGERTATVTQVFNYRVNDELVQGQGRGIVEVDETGNTLTGRSIFLSRFQDGRTDFAADTDDPGQTSIGTRVQPQPMASLADLMATPVPVGAATPTP